MTPRPEQPAYSAERMAENSVALTCNGHALKPSLSARDGLRLAGDLIAASLDALREDGATS